LNRLVANLVILGLFYISLDVKKVGSIAGMVSYRVTQCSRIWYRNLVSETCPE